MMKLHLREVKAFAQKHTAHERKIWDLDLGLYGSVCFASTTVLPKARDKAAIPESSFH